MAGSATAEFTAGTEELQWPLGGRDSRWPLFAQDAAGDQAKPNAWQVMVLSDLSGLEGRCQGATDGEVFGVLGQWGAAGAWLEGRKLAVLRELIRRRPDERNVGVATDSGLPWEWDDQLSREIALQLSVSVTGARKLLWTAWALEARLPKIGRALDDGRLDPGRAKMIVEETNVLLEPENLAQAQELILAGLAKTKTWMELLRLVQRAVVTVDPDGARKRREQEEKEHARVRFWRETAGTCALMGAGLPTDEALRAHAHVEQRAQQYREAGARRGIDILRVAAYLDLLNGTSMADRLARFAAEDHTRSDKAQPGLGECDPASSDRAHSAPSSGSPAPGGPPPDAPASSAPAHSGPCRGRLAPGQPADPGEPGPAKPGADGTDDHPWNLPPAGGHGGSADSCGTPGTAGHPGSVGTAAEVNLTLRHIDIPLVTAAGRAQRPGEARSLGTLDPALARRLAEAAARHPDSKFCVTIVNGEGHAIGHGCCKPRKRRSSRKGQRDGPPPPVSSAFTLSLGDAPGPPGGFGSWLLTIPGDGREFTVDLHPVPTGQCGHQYESARHDPGDLLRHLVNVRDGKCGFPACSRHARESDFEHATSFDKGGRTCGCNCWSCSRSCHQLKQSDGWDVTETRPGYHQWKTPSGRTYIQEPWRYPA
ncbi:MAG TPA: DUF222 domain-containing protein [Trebonia sp.]|nr:DUF222 domain-containing protein [Trebonia sp.]